MVTGPRGYQVKNLSYRELWWEGAEKAPVDIFPWGSSAGDDYRPKTSACLARDDTSLFAFMETDETDLRMLSRGFAHVHTDSCMELFISPDPGQSRYYLNFEFNPAGAMYLAIGTCRHDRTEIRMENYEELLDVKAAVHDNGWNIKFRIPRSFLRRFFPGLELNAGSKIRGNFYKCGDNTSRPHFGCWSPINLPKPDFHCPDYFGILNLSG